MYKRQEEVPERTNVWAWKHPHHDGTLTYTKLQGSVVFDDVDFGYDEGKLVLHNISPVSYTHLDVYKRQGSGRSFGPAG